VQGNAIKLPEGHLRQLSLVFRNDLFKSVRYLPSDTILISLKKGKFLREVKYDPDCTLHSIRE